MLPAIRLRTQGADEQDAYANAASNGDAATLAALHRLCVPLGRPAANRRLDVWIGDEEDACASALRGAQPSVAVLQSSAGSLGHGPSVV
jgi:hypothetical protein